MTDCKITPHTVQSGETLSIVFGDAECEPRATGISSYTLAMAYAELVNTVMGEKSGGFDPNRIDVGDVIAAEYSYSKEGLKFTSLRYNDITFNQEIEIKETPIEVTMAIKKGQSISDAIKASATKNLPADIDSDKKQKMIAAIIRDADRLAADLAKTFDWKIPKNGSPTAPKTQSLSFTIVYLEMGEKDLMVIAGKETTSPGDKADSIGDDGLTKDGKWLQDPDGKIEWVDFTEVGAKAGSDEIKEEPQETLPKELNSKDAESLVIKYNIVPTQAVIPAEFPGEYAHLPTPLQDPALLSQINGRLDPYLENQRLHLKNKPADYEDLFVNGSEVPLTYNWDAISGLSDLLAAYLQQERSKAEAQSWVPTNINGPALDALGSTDLNLDWFDTVLPRISLWGRSGPKSIPPYMMQLDDLLSPTKPSEHPEKFPACESYAASECAGQFTTAEMTEIDLFWEKMGSFRAEHEKNREIESENFYVKGASVMVGVVLVGAGVAGIIQRIQNILPEQYETQLVLPGIDEEDKNVFRQANEKLKPLGWKLEEKVSDRGLSYQIRTTSGSVITDGPSDVVIAQDTDSGKWTFEADALKTKLNILYKEKLGRLRPPL